MTLSTAWSRLTALALPVALASSLAGGCAGGITGQIDDENVPSFLSSGFVNGRVEVLGFSIAEQVVIRFVSFYGGCELSAADAKIINDEDDPADEADEREDLWAEQAPEEFWVMDITITGEDEDDLDGAELSPGETDDGLTMGVTLCHNTDRPEADGNVLVFDDDCFTADDGTLEFVYDKESAVSIAGDLEFQDEDGDNAGDVDFSASASFCEPADDEFEDFLGN